jgi:hypothetical protein
MKRIFTIIIAGLISASTYAQAPEKMSYQAVVRDGSNALVTSSSIGMQISILQGSSSGTAVYVETQTPTTNSNGLVSIEIGGGTIVSGTFTSIDWANGPYFVKTETDPTGGSTYSITGTSQLLSVPYTLYSKNSESATNLLIDTVSAPEVIITYSQPGTDLLATTTFSTSFNEIRLFHSYKGYVNGTYYGGCDINGGDFSTGDLIECKCYIYTIEGLKYRYESYMVP